MESFIQINPNIFFPLLFAFLYVLFEDWFKKIPGKWYAIGLLATVILALIFPLIGLKRYFIWIVTFSQMLMWVFTSVFMAKKMNNTVAFFLALLIGFIWALVLTSLVGFIYNI
ncbi:hypothetical protein [uncultured Lactobacillus sp.]|mgnify:CR=1 FL=1|uniref:hypothetical protein n=1 Tax=uncultured Lactobacillus sp. TaxID=153152 RepID=UPI0025892789|nr:hypothetical protein [uncultured Lactobacillus sp.]